MNREIPGYKRTFNGTPDVWTTQGFIASAVIDDIDRYSVRDATYDARLRADLEWMSVPNESDVPLTPSDPPYFAEICQFDCGFPYALPWDRYLERITGILDRIHYPLLVLVDENTDKPYALANWGGTWRLDFGEAVLDSTAWTFAAGQVAWRWVTAAEPASTLRQHAIDTRGVVLAPAGANAARAYRLDVHNIGMDVVNSGSPWKAAPGTPDSELVELPVGGKAVFSATRGELLLVGGSDLPAAERIRRYVPAAHTLDTVSVPSSLAPSSLAPCASVVVASR